ncbi:MAG: RNA polymerase-associated protein RapA [Opitutaceae bacterium]|nr:RNA polymerase-associated protein RapA [Opitutaceae bacterium]
MTLSVAGQRCLSEREPELGLGLVEEIDRARITILFPATGEKRIYARGTAVLKRVQFRIGDRLTDREGKSLTVDRIEEAGGLMTYFESGRSVREDSISDKTTVDLPQERLMAGQVDEEDIFSLRYRALQFQARLRQSEVRGFLGGRVELIPHQMYILREVTSRQYPRVLLADEVGLGKTIEACLIIQRLLAVGKARRVLILVPESLIHQWFVELLRRFNLWFGLYDEARCAADEAAEPGKNPFLSSQLALASTTFVSESESRRAQLIAAGWDMVVVDEAHHLTWTPEAASAEYRLVEELASKSPGLLLLTATPTQLGPTGHFARLRLLDPSRYPEYAAYLEETKRFQTVAGVAEKIVESQPLEPGDIASLKSIFSRDPQRLDEHLAALNQKRRGARENLLRTLLDQHGTGRVMFRNSRANIAGFPRRRLCPAVLPAASQAQLERGAREMEAEETGSAGHVRYALKDDPRVEWLVNFLQEIRPSKTLLICRSQRKVLALETAIKERSNVSVGLFHEGLPLVNRDRQAAWFAEPDGAQLLICSEIGSEGRNFQFSHHLVLWDLPLNPGLIEQRIGRLDRIGQTEEIRIHVPVLSGGADELVLDWYHRGLNAIEHPLHGGNDVQEAFRDRLLTLAVAQGEGHASASHAAREAMITETIAFREALALKLRNGRDRLLELNSFNPESAARVITRVREAEADPGLRAFLVELLDHFGVRIKEHEEGDIFLDPSHAYVEGFPSLPAEGLLATFSRKRALAREDIGFLTADHPLVFDSIDLLLASKSGTTAFSKIISPKPNLLLEAIFVLEPVAESRWHADQFLAPCPVRVVVDLQRRDVSEAWTHEKLAKETEDGSIARFLEKGGFEPALLKRLTDAAERLALARTRRLKQDAAAAASEMLTEERQRLLDLRKVNDHVRPEEIATTEERLAATLAAIEGARLRIDSLRLILEGPQLDD